jgi:hypothetical protein
MSAPDEFTDCLSDCTKMFIFLALYFKYSTDGYSNFTEVVLIADELNHHSASDSKLRHLLNIELSLWND